MQTTTVTTKRTFGQAETRQRLLDALEQASGETGDDWRESLSARKRAELEFHDRWRDAAQHNVETEALREESQANRKFYSVVGESKRYTEEWIERNARGRVFLDYACGDGENTIAAARAGAELAIGLDISPISVDNARRYAARAGVAENTHFVQADCEDTGLPPDSIDTVLCSGMLHHLDLSYAFPEMRRIMKPGGVCLAIEALNYNPAIKLYRYLTPSLRTEWEKEHILSLADVRFAGRFFDVRNTRYWHLASILATPLRRTPFFETALNITNRLDSALLRVPPLSLMAWMFTFELHKRVED